MACFQETLRFSLNWTEAMLTRVHLLRILPVRLIIAYEPNQLLTKHSN